MIILYIAIILQWSQLISSEPAKIYIGKEPQVIGYTDTQGRDAYLRMNGDGSERARFVRNGAGDALIFEASPKMDGTYFIKKKDNVYALGSAGGGGKMNATFYDMEKKPPQAFLIKPGRPGRYAIRYAGNCMLFHSSYSGNKNPDAFDAYFECDDAYNVDFTHVIGLFWVKDYEEAKKYGLKKKLK